MQHLIIANGIDELILTFWRQVMSVSWLTAYLTIKKIVSTSTIYGHRVQCPREHVQIELFNASKKFS
jgi:hypothetical protein